MDACVVLTNDDGIDAPGLALLERVARRFSDDVWVVAPDEERSGASHSITLSVPLRVRKIDERHFAVRGTPTDCVLMAYFEIMKEHRPAILLSGVNRGTNLAEDVTYSGTTMAALEGALLGIRSIALSQVYALGTRTRWETAEAHAPAVLATLLECRWQQGTFVNVNFPDVAPEAVAGTRVTSQGLRPPGAFTPDLQYDGRRLPYYWIRLAYPEHEREPGTDLAAIEAGCISVTPLQADLTAHDFARTLGEAFGAG